MPLVEAYSRKFNNEGVSRNATFQIEAINLNIFLFQAAMEMM